jgi:DNA polymerase III alpha subunit
VPILSLSGETPMAKHKPMACGFHAHSHFSIDGGSTVKKLVDRAKELGRTAMNLTDHGNMNGLADLHLLCSKAKIKPIHGIELYIINEKWFPVNAKGKQVFKHLTVHFVDQFAYEWFCKKSVEMEQRAVVIYGERKQILYWHELLEISDHIVLGSGCLGSFVMSAVRDLKNLELAEQIYCEIRSAVPKGRFFAEIFPHKLTESWQRPEYVKNTRTLLTPGYYKPNDPDPEDACGHAPLDAMKKPNEFILYMAGKYKDPVVISEDCVKKGTYVKTPKGYTRIEQILPGMYVLTHKGRFRKVLATRAVFTSKRKLAIFFNGYATLTVTEDHKIWVRKATVGGIFQRTLEPEWIEAKDLKKQDYGLIPIAPMFGPNGELCDLFVNTRPLRKLCEDGEGQWLKIKDIVEVGSEDSFHDLRVDEDNSFATDSIVVHNCHIATADEWSTQNIKMGRGADAWRFSVPYAMNETEYWAEHLRLQLGDAIITDKFIDEVVSNSYQFADIFDDYKFTTSKDKWILPTTQIVFGDLYKDITNKNILKKLIIEYGRFPKKSDPMFSVYMDRLTYEVSVLSDNGQLDLLPYFFVLADLTKWAKANKRICQARGSAGGSLVAYLLGISVTDPIKWGLQFERFLTLGRILAGTLPDIDCDFDIKDIVLDYLRSKYGDKMAKVSINTLMKIKSAIRDVERVERGEVSPITEQMCRKIPDLPQGIDAENWLNGYEDKETGAWVPGFIEEKSGEADQLRDYIKKEPKLWGEVLKCLGIVRQKSVHACGLLIADDAITKYTPITIIGDELVTAYCPKGCEYKGLVKFDILGVKTLEACRVTINSIFEHTGEKIEWKEFDHDPEVYSYVIGNKLLCGIFQIGTDTMRPYVIALNPKTTEELSNVIALVRPGTLDAPVKISEQETITAADFFVQCEQKKRRPKFIHPDLIPILGSTHSVLLFQEQALRIFRDLGNMTYEQAEVARRAIGKKDKELLAQEIGKLKQILLKKENWVESQAEELAEVIIASSRYSFNKCFSGNQKVLRLKGPYSNLTISELFKTKNDQKWAKENKHESLHKKLRKNGYGNGWSLCKDMRIRKNNIIDIRSEGIKDVFRLTTVSGKNVVCTWNHKFPTPSGEKLLSELNIHDEIYVNSGYIHEQKDYTFYQGKFFLSNVPQKGEIGFQKRPEGNSVVFEKVKQEKIETLTRCEICGNSFSSRKELHHIDGNHSNNEPSNLSLACVSCHKKAHYKIGRIKQGEKGLISQIEKILSIEYVGKEETYDIEMADPYHTVVMEGGVVASNSHSAAYGCVAYNGMWLKYHYPIHFYRGLLSIHNDNHDEIKSIVREAGDIILPPDVQCSLAEEWIIEGNKIRAPLCLIKGVGSIGANDLKSFIENGTVGLIEKEIKPKKVKTGLSKLGFSDSQQENQFIESFVKETIKKPRKKKGDDVEKL